MPKVYAWPCAIMLGQAGKWPGAGIFGGPQGTVMNSR